MTNLRRRLNEVESLADLETLARTDPGYLALAKAAARNLGAMRADTLEEAMSWLRVNADETGSEEGVVDEINFCI